MVDYRDRGGTRVILAQNEVKGRVIRAKCQSLLDAIDLDNVKAIDAMKIDVEGHEPQILTPFFRDAPEYLWPRTVDHRGRELRVEHRPDFGIGTTTL